MTTVMEVRGLSKTFTLHSQGGARIRVFRGLDLDLGAGECLALHGPSGSGKSTLLRSLYANYKPQTGSIRVRHGQSWVDMVGAEPRQVLMMRRATLGYVSQFLRVIPRVPALEIVARARWAVTGDKDEALKRARTLLTRLGIPERHWSLAPMTFSGGEQQRVNIARGFIVDYPILLLDEPTASLDADNRRVVMDMILEAKTRGAAIVGIFHDDEVRETVADRVFTMTSSEKAA